MKTPEIMDDMRLLKWDLSDSRRSCFRIFRAPARATLSACQHWSMEGSGRWAWLKYINAHSGAPISADMDEWERREGRGQPLKGDIMPAWLLLTRAVVRAPLQWQNTRRCTSSALSHHFAVRKPAFLSCSQLAPLMPQARGEKWVRGRWSSPEEKLISGPFVCLFPAGGIIVFAEGDGRVCLRSSWVGRWQKQKDKNVTALWHLWPYRHVLL